MATKLITVTEARARVLERVTPLHSELQPVSAGLGRVLAADVVAVGDVPRFPSSAMDGYAIHAGPAERQLTVVGESRAGTPAGRALRDGEAIRISTGAAVPDGATAVIPQEDVDADRAKILTRAEVRTGQNVRAPGEDMRAGTTILTTGTVLGGVELGAVVTAGLGRVPVAQRPRVAVLCTGDELRAPGEPLGPGEIHNSNAPMLTGLAAAGGAQTGEAQRLPDDRAATRAGIATALGDSDVVLISGGVSVGPHDHVKPVLADLGVEEVFWSVALQPGKPTWFGTPGDGRLVFGLPGNPVSAVVTFSLFVSPALAALQGTQPVLSHEATAVLGVEVRRNPRREQAIRVRLERGDGPPVATPNGAQGSHVLTSLIGADALAMIPAGEGTLPAGTTVALEALAG
ncbi:MAG: molybdopterin molybdotransferase MoeA [Solirubrobacteraceae bacterium]